MYHVEIEWLGAVIINEIYVNNISEPQTGGGQKGKQSEDELRETIRLNLAVMSLIRSYQVPINYLPYF